MDVSPFSFSFPVVVLNDPQIALRQLQEGSTRAPADLTDMALAPTCTLEQCHLITNAMYAVLDDSHLQTSRADKTTPVRQALCLAGLAPIIAKHYLASNEFGIVQNLVSHWDQLHQWIMYLKTDFIDQDTVDLSFRVLAKKCVASFLGICDDTFLRDSFDDLVVTPGIIATLFSLWRLESLDPRFSLSEDSSPFPVFHIPATLDSWMCAFSQNETWDWSEILRPFNGDAAALAATALDHLQRDLVRVPINYNLIVWDVHLLTTLSVNDSIRVSLLNKNSITLVTGVITSMVSRYAATQEHTVVAKCLSYGYWYIRAYIESTQGLPWVIQTVEAGLLPAILSTEPWFFHLEGQDSEDWEPLFLLLREIIPKYSVYSSALKHIIKQLTAIDMRNLPGELNKDNLLFQSWTIFESIVRRRAALFYLPASNETHIESCQNAKCDKSGPPGSFKTCAGCLHVYYCSKECQTNDWKNGNHRKYCHDIQARRAAGLASRLSKRDVHFIDRVIAQDLSLFRDGIQNASTAMNINPVVVELDYTEIPVHVEIGSTHTVPTIETCQCDVPVAEKWTYMVELAQKSTSKKVLVRAFLPGGTSEKMKLQCLPLKWVLGEHATGTDGEETVSEFDETFDLLYLRAGQSFGIVDAAFPNEAMRAMNDKEDEEEEDSDDSDATN